MGVILIKDPLLYEFMLCSTEVAFTVLENSEESELSETSGSKDLDVVFPISKGGEFIHL